MKFAAVRDPFEPVQFSPELLPVDNSPKKIKENEAEDRRFKVKLAGIVWDSVAPFALLNIDSHEKTVKIGTVFNDKKVIAINEDYIVLKTDMKEIILKVGQYLRL